MAIDPAADLGLFFADDNPWVDVADYAPPAGGAIVPGVRLIRDADNSYVDLGHTGVAADRVVWLARVAQLPAPEEGGLFVGAAKTWQITAPPVLQDRGGHVWRIQGRVL